MAYVRKHQPNIYLKRQVLFFGCSNWCRNEGSIGLAGEAIVNQGKFREAQKMWLHNSVIFK